MLPEDGEEMRSKHIRTIINQYNFVQQVDRQKKNGLGAATIRLGLGPVPQGHREYVKQQSANVLYCAPRKT